MKNKRLIASACVALAVLGNSTGWALACAQDGSARYICTKTGWVDLAQTGNSTTITKSGGDETDTYYPPKASGCTPASSITVSDGVQGKPFSVLKNTLNSPVYSTTSTDGACFVHQVIAHNDPLIVESPATDIWKTSGDVVVPEPTFQRK